MSTAPRLTRKQLAEFLQQRGYPLPKATIDKYASKGQGPAPDVMLGKRFLYTQSEALRWAESLVRPVK